MNIKEMKAKDKADEKGKAPPFGKKADDEKKAEASGPPAKESPKPKGKTPHMKGSSPMAEDEYERMEAEEGVTETDEALGDSELMSAGATAPQPTTPIPMTDVKAWTDAVNEAVGVLANGQVPPVTAELPEQASEWNKPLPANVFGLTVILMAAVAQQDPGGQFASLTFDPVALGSSPEGVKEMTDKLRMMASDPALKEALGKPVGEVDPSMVSGGAPSGAPMPPQPPMPGGDNYQPMV